MRNHGDSFHDPDHSYPALAGDLAEVIARAWRAGRSAGPFHGRQGGDDAGADPPRTSAQAGRDGYRTYAYSHDQTALIDAMEALDL